MAPVSILAMLTVAFAIVRSLDYPTSPINSFAQNVKTECIVIFLQRFGIHFLHWLSLRVTICNDNILLLA